MATYENDWEKLAKSSFNEIIKSNVRQSFYLLFVIFESIFLENKSCLDQMFHEIMFFLNVFLVLHWKEKSSTRFRIRNTESGSISFLMATYNKQKL